MIDMYVIKYIDGIYAGTLKNEKGICCYTSNPINKKKPKTFNTLSGAKKHIKNLIKTMNISCSSYNFEILEWTGNDLKQHFKSIGITKYVDSPNVGRLYKVNYWKNLFKEINDEISVKKIIHKDDKIIVTYLMPYSNYEYVFSFDINQSSYNILLDFIKEVDTNSENMICTIRECAKGLRNQILKKERLYESND